VSVFLCHACSIADNGLALIEACQRAHAHVR
jgi:hypothetical protein